jgi:hypothetical protein
MAERYIPRITKRGFATYYSWGAKIGAAIFAILMSIFSERPATDIAVIAGIIMGTGVPIDVAKVVNAVRQPYDKSEECK